MCCPQPQRAVHPLLSAPSLSTHPTAMAETRKPLCFSTADRRRTCPYPRIVRTTASADRTSASTLRRRCRRLIPHVSSWSKDKSIWSLFRGQNCLRILSAAEVGECCTRLSRIFHQLGASPCPLGSRPHANPNGGSLVRNINNLHF
jgi:hypothetical protein